jgi:prefoldin subunit 5
MLIEKSKQLIKLSQKKSDIQKYATNLQGFQARQTQIEQAIASTIPLVEILRAFRQREILNFDLTQKANILLAFIADAELKFREEPEWIIDNKNFGKNSFNLKLEQLQNALREQLSQAWRTYRSQKMPSTNNEILNLLERVTAFRPTVQRIKNLDLQIQQVTLFPQSSEEFIRIEQLIEQLKQCWDSLNADEVPETVLRFLRVAANQGASLSLLTPEVKDWLTQHGLIDSLRVRLT